MILKEGRAAAPKGSGVTGWFELCWGRSGGGGRALAGRGTATTKKLSLIEIFKWGR